MWYRRCKHSASEYCVTSSINIFYFLRAGWGFGCILIFCQPWSHQIVIHDAIHTTDSDQNSIASKRYLISPYCFMNYVFGFNTVDKQCLSSKCEAQNDIRFYSKYYTRNEWHVLLNGCSTIFWKNLSIAKHAWSETVNDIMLCLYRSNRY